MKMKRQNELKGDLYNKGFNLFGVCSVESYNNSVSEKYIIPELFPFKSLIIFGSGGKYFWEIFNKFHDSKEGNFLKNTEDPIDIYTEFIVNSLLNKYPELTRKSIFPFKRSDLFIDFQKLAVSASIGHFSPYIKLVLHTIFGPWVSLRGVFLTDLQLVPTDSLLTAIPCTNCSKPCLDACPVNAVTSEEFNFITCANYRNLETDCLSACHVRSACIVGPENAYTYKEGLHRNKSSLKTLRSYLNISKKP